ncbi:hypothetical protein BCS7_19565 [Pectobacterium odoriferum]|nr:hypothetical protein BCS7_19565 [Pectobacterium odoriferum]
MIGGMLAATFLAIFFVPLFFVVVRRRFPLKERGSRLDISEIIYGEIHQTVKKDNYVMSC